MEIFAFIVLGFLLLALFYAVIQATILSIELYFLTFKLDKYPHFLNVIDATLRKICKDENIAVFDKTYNEINTDDKGDAIGKYIYTLNDDYKVLVKNSLRKIEEIEKEYNKPYEEICEMLNIEEYTKKEELLIPRILLAKDTLKKFGYLDYYKTFIHELGHHFAANDIGKHTEEDADNYGNKLTLKHFPQFFVLFLGRGSYINKLSIREKIKLYLNFYFNSNKLNYGSL